jgi:anaphase-promoting complex subunit 6
MSTAKKNVDDSNIHVTATLESTLICMKNLLKHYMENGLYSNALFYANKIFYLSFNRDVSVISDHLYDLAHCFYMNKEFYRCVNVIQKYNVTYYSLKFLNLLGQALLACEDYEGVITYLEKENLQIEQIEADSIHLFHSIRHLLIGKAYEMQENKQPAIRNYIKALKYDPGNVEAFEILISHNLLTSEQKHKLMNELVFENNKWLHDYYLSKAYDNIYITEKSDVAISDENGNIIDILYTNNDQDLMKMEAEKFYISRDHANAYNKLKKINDDDFYYLDIIPMFCSSMIELNKIGELYYLAHKLANNCSDKYVSWFAVGCYYYCVKKYDIARKYFSKANQLNKHFPEGWIALGNCYAAQDESDQALSAYRTCLRLFPGCHFANLYIGMEFVRTNNLKTALVAFQDALLTSNSDPLVYNELGVVFYKQKFYEEAEFHFLKGIELCREEKSSVFQSLTINLANTNRKLKYIYY